MGKVKFGDIVTDRITGFSGVVVARIEYDTGCVRYSVQPSGLHDGKMIEAEWIDESRLIYKKDPHEGPQKAPPDLAHP